ncbi:MAG: tetratricopeptide repeat protein, partial [Nitrososphaerales archaeon]
GTEEHLWSSNYDSRLDDIFAIQTDVASKVAASLSAGLFFSPAPRKETSSVEAYTLYLRAMQLSYDGTEPGLREAVALLQRAISMDPTFARAYAGLAEAWEGLALNGYEEFAVAMERAEPAAQRALDLEPDMAEVHAAMAGVHSMMDRFDQALAEAEAAIGINPNLSDAYISLGVLDSIRRTVDDALPIFKRAYELDPLSMAAGELLAMAAQVAGETELARDVLTRMMEVSPRSPRILASFASYHARRGEFEEAQRMLDRASEISPGEPVVQFTQGLLFASAGRRAEAEATLGQILSHENESVRLTGKLWIQAALGNLDEAFDALMKLAETHSWPFLIGSDPVYAGMRRDPRYLEFRRRVGLEGRSRPPERPARAAN